VKTVSHARNNTPARRPKFQILGAEQNKNIAAGCEQVENEFKGGSHVKSLMILRTSAKGRNYCGSEWTYGPDSPAGPSGQCAQDEALSPVDLSNGRINALVCMFNSFALAGPFCERMKIPAFWGDRLLGLAAPSQTRRHGAVESHGVDRLVHFSRHHGRVPDHPGQSDSRDLVHAGDARFRPDYEPAADATRFHWHHRNDRAAYGDDDRAYSAGHGGGARPQ
jgi:hypothetical protein